MRAALVDGGGLIVNVIVVDEGVEYAPPEGLTLVADPADMAEPGGSWDGSAFYPAPPLPSRPMPESVTPPA